MQAGAFIECPITDTCDSVRERDRGQRSALPKSRTADTRHAVRNCDGGQGRTPPKCSVFNARYAVRNAKNALLFSCRSNSRHLCAGKNKEFRILRLGDEPCSVGNVLNHGSHRRRPAKEQVSASLVCRLFGDCTGVARRRTILHAVRRKDCSVVVFPCYRILVGSFAELRGIGRIAGHSLRLSVPPAE